MENETNIQSQTENIKIDELQEEDEKISFADLGLDEKTLAAIEKKGFVNPSPIQVLAIPRLLNGEANIIAKARTGTGKTAAFGLPLVQKISNACDSVKAIILEPTRELAMQTASEMASFTTGIYPRTAVVYGGASMGAQIRELKKGVEIVVGTPGRVQDLMDRGILDISKIDYFILDEGDEMLDMGFVDDIEKIFSCAPENCRVLLFSATVPSPILKIASKFMGEYEIIEEENHEEAPLLIEQKFSWVRESEKIEALVRLIDISPDFYGLVFTQKKTDADYVCKALDERGYEVAALHGDIPQGQREKILSRFRAKKTRILVATDVAARGIDIGGLTHVVNYELPFDGPTYVHRIGRTGRAGSEGMAVTFVRPEERRRLSYLQTAIRKSAKGQMTEVKVPSVEEVIEAKKTRLFDDVKKKLSAEKIKSEEESIFDTLAEQLCQNQNAQDVLSSLLEATYGSLLSRKRYGKINALTLKQGREGREQRRLSRSEAKVAQGQMRLYVQLGWHDRENPKSIAEFFSKLLHIPNRMVDRIDMADKFCLLNLPEEAAKRALELSEKDKTLPHMHEDTKVSYSASRTKNSFGQKRERYAVAKKDGEKKYSSEKKASSSKGKVHGRANVHTPTERNSQASLYKKKSKATEY